MYITFIYHCAGIHVVEVVAGVRVTTATEEGFAIALTNTGDVYSWGKSYRGRLGHPMADNQRHLNW